MNNERVIKRLKQKKWYVECQTNQEVDLVLHACDDAEIKEESGEKATKIKRYYKYPILIGYPEFSKGIEMSLKERCEALNMENITDWFFDAIKNNDGNLIPKLTPQNAEQEHLVQILLAMMQKIPVEVNISGEWELSIILFPTMNYEYRIKQTPTPTPTPIPVSRKTWKKINKEFRFIVMDKNKHFYHCKNAPKSSDKTWLLSEVDHVKSPLIFDSIGINWETSLTERPKGI